MIVEDEATCIQGEVAVAELSDKSRIIHRQQRHMRGGEVPCDERLRRIVRVLARQLAREHHARACTRQEKDSECGK